MHGPFTCDPCGVMCTNGYTHRMHLDGKKHRRVLQGPNSVMFCTLCLVSVSGGACWNQHIRGMRHNSIADAQGVNPDVEPGDAGLASSSHEFCSICNFYVHSDVSWRHSDSKRHQRMLKFSAAKIALEQAAKDKHGVSVSHQQPGVDFGVVEVDMATRGTSATLMIENTTPASNIIIREIKILSYGTRLSGFSIAPTGSNISLACGKPVSLEVSLMTAYRGIYNDILEMTFEDSRLHKMFVICRPLRAVVGSQADYDALRPVAPFVPRTRTTRDPEINVVAGDPPPSLNAIRYIVSLPEAEIPLYAREILAKGSGVHGQTKNVKNVLLPKEFCGPTYAKYFKVLLWTEEYRSNQDLEIYDIAETTLTHHNSLYYLDVPGLAEKRPSVLVGDDILIQPVDTKQTGKWFQGCVHVVREHEVGMKFDASFHAGHFQSRSYRARFEFNRFPLRRQYQALDMTFEPNRLLFPSPSHIVGRSVPPVDAAPSTFGLYNQVIASNPPQLQAVTSVSRLPPGSAPFGIFGPPGTGKTITLVECIMQIYNNNPQARILACAPSNSAADLIASRLAKAMGPDALFRFYAPSRFKNKVPYELEKYTATTPDGHFTAPPIFKLKDFRVIVSTCVSASFAHGVGLPRGHFSHMFFDEAGHATEPEVMIAVRTMADDSTNVVVAGDPKQLGPIIRSPIARELGLEQSYLERLMKREIYDVNTGYGLTVVRLTYNFRSHPKILEFPNSRFYEDCLRPFGDPNAVNAYVGHKMLPNPEFPVLFHALCGKDDREANSPSFFNILEVQQVKAYVDQLRNDRGVRTTDHDIGVIAPYHAQCCKLRTSLRQQFGLVKVGSVEEFQGQERSVIIISTVRSSREFVEYDLKHTLGFVASPRRLNVAITRAKALLIIVGDPTVLSLDPLWRLFLNFIHQNGGWKGEPPTWDTSASVRENGGYDEKAREAGFRDMNEFARRMEEMTRASVSNEAADDDVNVDRPWRELE